MSAIARIYAASLALFFGVIGIDGAEVWQRLVSGVLLVFVPALIYRAVRIAMRDVLVFRVVPRAGKVELPQAHDVSRRD
jgi:hypothetical protein